MTIKTELTGVMLAALLLTGSCFAQSPQKRPVTSFRDCAECPDMVVIPAGSFMMGDAGSKGEGPRHHVTIGYRFAVAKYPVTRDEYGRFVVESGYSAGDKWTKPPFPQTGNDPVVFVSWDDAKAYVKWLSVKTRHQYRLLSEAEYEYAERAGTTTKYWWGDHVREFSGIAGCVMSFTTGTATRLGKRDEDVCAHVNINYCCNGSRARAGSYPANGFGLYDMVGNVDEWVEDCWHGSYEGAPRDGSAWTSGDCDSRVLRGGAYDNSPAELRSTYRYYWFPYNRLSFFGFRVARTL